MTAVADLDLDQATRDVAAIMEVVTFLYPNEQYPHDETTVRAMLVQGGTVAQIKESIAIAAINTRVERDSKTRYAYGVLRNLMHPHGMPEDEDWNGEEPYYDDMSSDEEPQRRPSWWKGRR